MPRIRTLKPECLSHRKVGRLSDRAFRLWVGMILQADDEGRLVADPEALRVTIWGYHRQVTADHVSQALAELGSAGLIRIYSVEGTQYADFPSWRDHQRVGHPVPSKLPSFNDSRKFSNVLDVSSLRGTEGKEGEGREGKGREGKPYRKGREGKGREGNGREGKGRERNGKERNGKEGNGKEGKGKDLKRSTNPSPRPEPDQGAAPVPTDPPPAEGAASATAAQEEPWGRPEHLVELYNRLVPPGHPRVARLTPARREKARKYLLAFPDRRFWVRAFTEIRHSQFLRGLRNGPGHQHFIADFDWLLARGKDGTENVAKVAEGKYRDE